MKNGARQPSSPLDAPNGDMVILDLEAEGNYVAVRPSGTEPKVKIYLFAYDPPSSGTDPWKPRKPPRPNASRRSAPISGRSRERRRLMP